MDLMGVEVTRLDKEKETGHVMKQIKEGMSKFAGSRGVSLTETKCGWLPRHITYTKNVSGYHNMSQKNVAGYHDISLTDNKFCWLP
jgi:hypothetical protein